MIVNCRNCQLAITLPREGRKANEGYFRTLTVVSTTMSLFVWFGKRTALCAWTEKKKKKNKIKNHRNCDRWKIERERMKGWENWEIESEIWASLCSQSSKSIHWEEETAFCAKQWLLIAYFNAFLLLSPDFDFSK